MCGTGDGVLNIFNWGEWGNISDRFPGHPMSVDCMVQITEDIICTGSIDGIIRLVSLYNLISRWRKGTGLDLQVFGTGES